MLYVVHVAEFAVDLPPTEPAVEHGKPTSAEASSSEAPRYPKRSVTRKNYHESSDEETDPADFCFCKYNTLYLCQGGNALFCVCLCVCLSVCLSAASCNKKLSYRKETVRLLHNIEIRVLHKSHIVLIGLVRSNREHRLTFRRAIIEKWMYIAQVPINNALVLGNLCEYRHK